MQTTWKLLAITFPKAGYKRGDVKKRAWRDVSNNFRSSSFRNTFFISKSQLKCIVANQVVKIVIFMHISASLIFTLSEDEKQCEDIWTSQDMTSKTRTVAIFVITHEVYFILKFYGLPP
jgi:hypothetical protein